MGLQEENAMLKQQVAELQTIIDALRLEISTMKKPNSSEATIIALTQRINQLEAFIGQSQKR